MTNLPRLFVSTKLLHLFGLALLLLFLALAAIACGEAPNPVFLKAGPAHPTRILAKAVPGIAVQARDRVLSDTHVVTVREYGLVPGLVMLEIDRPARPMTASGNLGEASSVDQAVALLEHIEALRASGLYEYVEPDYYVFPDKVPTDTSFANGTLWGLRNTGQSGGTSGVDIDAVRAWDTTTGSNAVVVAVVDSGIRYTHQDLSTQMWKNPGEIAGNGIDDDHDGYVDDVYGINAVTGSGDPMDDFGHGTHVAGTIGAAANNAGPHVGVAWNVRLMACKFFDANDGGTFSDLLECYDYAVAHGAKIINCSFGSTGESLSERHALEAAREQGVLIVAAAGNENTNNDNSPHYPSGYDLDNVIAVAAIDRYGSRASFSNFGQTSVDLGAPGVDIYSTYNGSDSDYYTADGTSMATPHVVGVAALVRAKFPGISVWDLRDRILGTTTATASLNGKTVTGGRVNAYQALTSSGDGSLKLAVTPKSGSTLILNRASPIVVRVKDLVGITGATVTGTAAGGISLTFRDDGVAPDEFAGDARYTANLTPSSGTNLSLTINASASGKKSASASVSYSLQAPPANDNFASRITLNFVDGSTTGSNVGGTLESGEPMLAGELGGASVWWTWTAPQDTSVTVSTEGSNFDTLLGVFTGTRVDALTEIASNDDIDGPNQPSKVVFSATGGTTYQIVVDGWEGKTGSISLSIKTAIPPANDRFDKRITLSGATGSTSGSVTNATIEAGEPAHLSDPYVSHGSVWWSWTAPSSGTARFHALLNANGYPCVVAAYTGTSLASLVRMPGHAYESEPAVESYTTFAARAGVTYQIAVAVPDEGTTGQLNMNWTVLPGPANDLFDDATVLSGESVNITGSNVDATREAGEPLISESAAGYSVWWTWVAPFSGTLTLDASGSAVTPCMALYSGSNLSSLQLVGSSVTSGGTNENTIVAPVTSGTVYHFAVDSRSGSPGSISLTLSLREAPSNDLFTNRIVVAGSSTHFSGTTTGASKELSEPSFGDYAAGTTIWWTWTAPESGTATIEVQDGRGLVRVFTGSTLGSLVPIANSEDESRVRSRSIFRAIAGATYQIGVDAFAYQAVDVEVALDVHQPPSNDDFAARATLSGTSESVNADNTYATGEAGEPAVSSGGRKASLWWKWTAPSSGTAVVSTPGVSYGLAIAAFTGTALETLNRVTLEYRSDWGIDKEIVFKAVAGTTYQIAVDADSDVLAFVLHLEHYQPPSNDDFAHRLIVSGTAVALTGSNVGATREEGEPHINGYYDSGASVWWTWTASFSGTIVIDLSDSAFSNAAALYTGTSLNSLDLVADSSNRSPGDRRIVASVTGGVTYQILVVGSSGQWGQISVSLSLVHAPANDMFAQRTDLTGRAVDVDASNVGATIQTNEPAHDGGWSSGGASVWWSWTAPESGKVAVSTAGSDFNTMLSVYTGTDFPWLERVASNLNEREGVFTSFILFDAVAGTTYQIAVDGWNRGTGNIHLDVHVVDPPSNDNFASRTALEGAPVIVHGTTLGASKESGETVPDGSAPGATVWWKWTAPKSGTARVELSDLGFYSQLAVYSGSQLNALTLVSSADWSSNNHKTVFHADGGVTYAIAIGAQDGVGGAYTFSISLVDGPPNDMFADRAALSGGSVSVSGATTDATYEQGEERIDWNSPAGSLWWSWSPGIDGLATLTIDSQQWPHIAVYTGQDLLTLQRVDGVDSYTSFAAFPASQGVAYQIAVAGGDQGATFTLTGSVVPAPENDRFANRTVLEGTKVSVSGTTTGASWETGESSHGGINSWPHSIWWSWTAPSSGRVIVDTQGSAILTALAVYRGSAMGSLSQVAVADITDVSNGRAQIVFNAVAGTAYQIAVADFWGTPGSVVLNLERIDMPANDGFATRTAVNASSAIFEASNRGATAEANEPQHGGNYRAPWASLWWSWTAPKSGRTVVVTRAVDFDPTLDVYTGTNMGTLNVVRSLQAYPRDGGACFAAFDAVGGETYQIAVDGAEHGWGDFTLEIEMLDPPVNDRFANRTILTGNGVSVSGSNLGAVPETGEPQHAGNSGSSSVWWTWTAPDATPVSLSTDGSDFDTTLAVYTGNVVNALSPVLSSDDISDTNFASRLILFPVPGQTYQIAVAGGNSAMGEIQLSIAAFTVPAISLGGTGGTVVAGSSLTMSLYFETNGEIQYQWLFNGEEIPDANEPSLTLGPIQGFQSGSYSVRLTGVFGTLESPSTEILVESAQASDSRLTNISTRALCRSGDGAMIPGFVIAGSGTKQLLIRAVGPTLVSFGVSDALSDTRVDLYRMNGGFSVPIAANDNWASSENADALEAAASTVGAFSLERDSRDAALLVDLPAGQYSAVARGSGTASGIGLVEIYDVSGASTNATLVNLSNRGFVGIGSEVMIPGIVISSEGPKTLLIRGIGPELASFGVSGVLADPKLEVWGLSNHSLNSLLMSNDDWGGADVASASAAVGAFPLPTGSKDAAMLITLPPGAYTAIVSGTNGGTGVALVEVYVVP